MEQFHECLVCGASPYLIEDAGGWHSLHCHSCGARGPRRKTKEGAVVAYNYHCETIVSRVLSEAVKDARQMESQTYDGCEMIIARFVDPGTYALIPVKEDE